MKIAAWRRAPALQPISLSEVSRNVSPTESLANCCLGLVYRSPLAKCISNPFPAAQTPVLLASPPNGTSKYSSAHSFM